MRRVLLLQSACLLGACAPVPVTAPAAPARPAQLSCEPARDADFEAAGEAQLRSYVAWLAQTYGHPVALQPHQVSLGIVRGPAKPGPLGIQAAEIACGAEDYRITLYRNALAGRSLAMTYRTVAHEFHHIVQIRRDRLDCEASQGRRERYEREADEFATSVVPACLKPAPVPASGLR